MIPARTPYEMFPYSGVPIPNTAPNHLLLCALWHQGPRPPFQCFRLVELGCGDGVNLLPLAFYSPDSTFIGIDDCRVALDHARSGAKYLGLKNIQFVLEDVSDINPTGVSPCDYIIAHGLYSWVPDDARDTIYAFCRQSLAPSGLAYISYNAQPGWATRKLVRETLLRSRPVREAEVENRTGRAIEVATQLLEDLPSRDYAFAALLAEELERVRSGEPSYVFHEYLADTNDGFWLRDFVDRAKRHGLDYVTDAQFCRWEGHVSTELKEALSKRDLDLIEQEEAADLLCNRYFHASILCRGNAERNPSSHRHILEEVYIATSLCGESDPFDLTDGVVERFFRAHGPEITLDASITKAGVVVLAARWPVGLRLEELFQQATSLLLTHGCEVQVDARSQLVGELIMLFEAGQIDLRLWEPSYNAEVPEFPQAHALARFEAERRDALTTPYHLPLPFETQALALVLTLDGLRSQTELKRVFGADLVEQTLPVLGRWGLLARETGRLI